MTDSAFLGLRCTRCGTEFHERWLFAGCPACLDGGSAAGLEAVYDYRQAAASWGRSAGPGLWRYSPLLPVRQERARITLGEGATPLTFTPGLGGVANVWVKNETQSPTWSYKDRMSAVGISVAIEMGRTVIGISSTGNQGASGSAYAAHAGLASVVLTLESVQDPTLAFMQSYGAFVGRTSRVGRRALLRHGVETLGWFPLSSYTATPTSNPYAIEGYKTIAYELTDDLGRAPDVVVVPTSLGEGLAGIHAGFRDLALMGLIDRIPRMVAAEPAGGGPLSKSLREGALHPLAVEEYTSIALTLATTVATDRALLALRESDGAAVQVTDAKLLAAQDALRVLGLLAEPAASAAVAALPHLAEALPRFDPETSRVVVLMTGTGLRDLPGLRNRLRPVETLDADPELFDRVWRVLSEKAPVVPGMRSSP